jgi:hypothetical protein
MTVKLECVYKHVVHDWKEALTAIAWGVWGVVVFICELVILGCIGSVLASPTVYGVNFILGLLTGYNIMAVLTTINIIACTSGIACCWNKDSFKKNVTDTDEHGTPLSTTHEEITSTWEMVFVSMFIEGFVFFGFVVVGAFASLWYIYFESPLPILLAWAICAVIGIPIACAIARCKE